MKCLVTGGAGFIGSHLIDRLLEDGHEVITLGHFSPVRAKNLAQHRDSPRLHRHEVDITDWETVQPYFSGVDWVFHTAASVVTRESVEEPRKYFQVNVDGTANVFEAARMAGVRKFIYLASGSCYGYPDVISTPETTEIRLDHPYALTKYLGEQSVLFLGKIYHIPVISLRLFYVYGPRTRPWNVLSVFMRQKIAGEPLTIVGDGEQRTDFVYISDAVEAMIMAAESDLNNEILNVGSGESHTMNEFAKALGGEIKHIPKRPYESDYIHADISKIRRLLGWEPKVSFEEGMKIVLDNIDYWR